MRPMAGEDRVLAGGAKFIDFQTDPSRYKHWKLDVVGDVGLLRVGGWVVCRRSALTRRGSIQGGG